MRTPVWITVAMVVLGGSPMGFASVIHVPADQPTIQAGIAAASEGDTVIVACGHYYEHDITMNPGVTLTSATGLADCVTVDAQSLGRVFYCGSDVDDSAAIIGFTITHGYLEEEWATAMGAGIYCHYDASPTVANCRFFQNTATGGGYSSGAGMYCNYGSSPTLTDCTFEENASAAPAARGGGIAGSGSFPTLTDCTFLYNTARRGGAMCWESNSTITLTECTFSHNTVYAASGPYPDGGAICCEGGTEAVLTACTFSDNFATRSAGAVFCPGGGRLTFVDCAFSDNFAGNNGGGICTEGNTTLSLTGCAFLSNTAGSDGGGACFMSPTSATVTDCVFSENSAAGGGGLRGSTSAPFLTGCTFSLNAATYDGGGAHFLGASPTLTNCTFAGNSASSHGSGLFCYAGDQITLANCIIAFGETASAIGCHDASSNVVLTCCDIYGNAGGDWVTYIADQFGANGNICEDPLFCENQYPSKPFTLDCMSPCADLNHPECDLIGAWPVGCCDGVATKRLSWGAIKAMYR